ncbi:MAG: helix-turn-helix domain-containing protein [Gammaproteobacteria bacterium]|nr:helix-turn-helix domain-containing protein [Gammaproteobacteria bacterium]MBU0786495.1 helix-turn-helix domain-containing protein [Gammaproteobacteria bacterium]MBU0816198.1 helix-turn-helix domain-containing protein [Gammaproteobacteria bacterium]MBU1787776.1 helix-turn-helix domain-containing protein [Gammaproteobacteria bacterium]
MSEMETQTEAVVEPMAPAEVPQPKSAGTLLREAREAAGLHIAAMAVSMKVPVKKLEALEADQLDLLPDAVFVRALASSVCRSLKIDPQPILERLPLTAAPRLHAAEMGINTPFHSHQDRQGESAFTQISKPLVLAALTLLVAALVLIFFPTAEQTALVSEVTAERTLPTLPAPVPLPAEPVKLADEDVAKQAPAAAGASVPAAATAPSAGQPVAVVAPPVLANPAPGATPPAVTSGSGVVVFKLRGDSWVEVVDAKGVVQLRRILAMGETVGVSGALPLAVVVGRADVTEIQVRGKAFDLAAVSKENVARFEVK